jgi:gluconolactonase
MSNQVEIITEGLQFPEGPVVMVDGSVIVVEAFGGQISRCWNGRKQVICAPGGGPNGGAIGPDGALYVCNNGGIGPKHYADPESAGRIERVDLATGRFERIYTACGDRKLSAPNDLMFDIDGNMWFTDFGRLEQHGKQFGGLYCCRADGSSITRIVDRATSYNGVGISPDMASVYVADTIEARIYAVERRVELQKPRFVTTVPGKVGLDSLAMTAAGNICVATIGDFGAISTVTPQGEVTATPMEDQLTTNIAFGGADMRDAYITWSLKGMLVKMRWAEPGMRLVYNA